MGILFYQGIHIVGFYIQRGAGKVDLSLDQIGTHLLKLVVHIVLHSVAQAGDDDDGGHADDDAQHGQQRPHLTGHKAFDGQLEGLSEIHASTSPVRRAVKPSPASPSLPSSGWTTAWGSWESPS